MDFTTPRNNLIHRILAAIALVPGIPLAFAAIFYFVVAPRLLASAQSFVVGTLAMIGTYILSLAFLAGFFSLVRITLGAPVSSNFVGLVAGLLCTAGIVVVPILGFAAAALGYSIGEQHNGWDSYGPAIIGSIVTLPVFSILAYLVVSATRHRRGTDLR